MICLVAITIVAASFKGLEMVVQNLPTIENKALPPKPTKELVGKYPVINMFVLGVNSLGFVQEVKLLNDYDYFPKGEKYSFGEFKTRLSQQIEKNEKPFRDLVAGKEPVLLVETSEGYIISGGQKPEYKLVTVYNVNGSPMDVFDESSFFANLGTAVDGYGFQTGSRFGFRIQFPDRNRIEISTEPDFKGDGSILEAALRGSKTLGKLLLEKGYQAQGPKSLDMYILSPEKVVFEKGKIVSIIYFNSDNQN